MHRLRSLTLSQKLVTALAVCGLVPAIAIAWMTYSTSSATLTSDVGKSFAQEAAALNDTIDRNLFERYGDVQAFGVNQAVYDRGSWYKPGADANAVARVANTYVALYGIYTLSIVTDLDGRVVAVNDRDAAGKPIDTAWIYGQRYGDAAWFKDALAGRFLTQQGSPLTGTTVTDVFDDADTKRVYGGSGRVVAFTAPVHDAQGKVIAIWHNRAAFSLVEDIVKSAQASLAGNGFTGARVTLVNREGHVLFDYAPPGSGVKRAMPGSLAAVAAGKDGHGEEADPEEGDWHIVGYAKSKGALGYAGLGWGTAIADDTDEALVEVHTLRNRTLTILGVCLALLVGVAVWLARSISAPMIARMDVLAEGARQVSSASEQVSSSAQTLSQGATEQAASLEQTSASLEEMAAMTRRNAESSSQAAALMAEVNQQVSGSNAALQQMVRSMGDIRESSVKVSKIIKTIDEIAFQTNILALNAAVEAARAGDAGMGFAVVADEVRNLAQRSAQAARDTAVLIEESTASATTGTSRVGELEAAMQGITSSVAGARQLVESVNAASREQAQGIEQVTLAISQMEKVTLSTAATAEENAAASEELNAQAETSAATIAELERMVGAGTRNGVATPAAARVAQTSRPAAAVQSARVLPMTPQKPSPSASSAEEAIPFGDTGTFGSF
ncbi:MAG: methyl-accepting chemotaxis protein [Vicinamibacterales bacterium]